MANEVAAAIEIVGDAADRLVVTPAETMHRAVASRVFTSVGAAATPTRVIHDAIAPRAYGWTRTGIGLAAKGAAIATRLATANLDVRPINSSAGGRRLTSAVNALLGDRLAENGNDLAIPLSLRHRGRDVPARGPQLRKIYRRATPRLVIFLHGLGEDESVWGDPNDAKSFGYQLKVDFEYSALYVRYNSGLALRNNGLRLSRLIEDLITEWPVRVREVVLVGHSMGGLVARAAWDAGTASHYRWVERTSHIIFLGSPHTGAPLAKGVQLAARGLQRIPEGRALAGILESRSAGIRDLERGYGGVRNLTGRRTGLPTAAPGALAIRTRTRTPATTLLTTHTFVSASVGAGNRNPLGWLVGDYLVRVSSAQGVNLPQRPGGRTNVAHIGRMSHFAMLRDPRVYEIIRLAIAEQREKR